jgi:hypothetical protein
MKLGRLQLRARRRWGLRRPGLLLAIEVATLGIGCSTERVDHSIHSPGGTVLSTWIFATPDGRAYSSDQVLGRVTVVLFLTTYDTASQIAATRFNSEIHSLSRRVNALAVALEPPNHSVLVGVFRDSLHLTYPLLMPDPATLAGHGPFGVIDVVPTWVVLDSSGREIWRRSGVDAISELRATLHRVGVEAEQ